MIGHNNYETHEIIVHTVSMNPVFVQNSFKPLVDKFFIPGNADRGFSIIMAKIVNEPGLTNTTVDYLVEIIFGWANGKFTKTETAGTYNNTTGFLMKNMSDFVNDVYFPNYFQIKLIPSAGTSSDVRVIINII